MKSIKLLTVAAMLGAASMSSQASDFSYTYLDLGFGNSRVDDGIDAGLEDDGGDYSSIQGSFEISGEGGPYLTIESTSYEQNLKYTGGTTSFDVDITSVGYGANTPLTGGTSADLYGTIQLVSVDNSTDGSDDTGFRINVGTRLAITNHLEFEGKVKYEDIYNDSSTKFAAGLRYYPSAFLAASINYETVDYYGLDISATYLALRMNF